MEQGAALFLLPFLLHFGIICLLYAWLTFERQRAVLSGISSLADFVRANGDPKVASRVQRNLANQFELPVFALFAAVILIISEQVGWLDVVAAWLFLIGRLIHSSVQCFTDNVALRGQVFVINFIAVIWLMGHVGFVVLDAMF